MTGTELREARDLLGLSRTKFADLIGISADQVYSLEVGRRDITLTVDLAVRYRLTEAGRCTVADFAT